MRYKTLRKLNKEEEVILMPHISKTRMSYQNVGNRKYTEVYFDVTTFKLGFESTFEGTIAFSRNKTTHKNSTSDYSIREYKQNMKEGGITTPEALVVLKKIYQEILKDKERA